MTTYTEAGRISDFLRMELDKNFNREVVTVVSGQNLVAGTVVGKVTASGKYAAYDNDAATGIEAVGGILLFDCDASGGDKKATILARGPAIVNKDGLVWGAAVTTQGEKDAAYVDMIALGIIPRDAV